MTEQKLDELLPCPFHKLSTSVELADNDYGRWFVVCGGCGASSGHCKTKERAVYSWNNDRASTTRESELQAEVKTIRTGYSNAVKDFREYAQKCSELQAEVERLKVGMAMVEPFLEEITTFGGKYHGVMSNLVYDTNSLKRELALALNQED